MEQQLPDVVADYTESADQVAVVLRRPTTRYFDQLLRMRCAEALIGNRVFPVAKEVTESFAVAAALLHRAGLDPRDPSFSLVVVGDGSTPRTAATLAMRSSWRCISVDPLLRPDVVDGWPTPVERLEVHPVKIQRLAAVLSHPIGPCAVAFVHAHVRLAKAVESVEAAGGDVSAVVSLPCCGYGADSLPGFVLHERFDDWGIWSPHRQVSVWRPADDYQAT